MLTSKELVEVLKEYPDLPLGFDFWDGPGGKRFVCSEITASDGVFLHFELTQLLRREDHGSGGMGYEQTDPLAAEATKGSAEGKEAFTKGSLHQTE